MRKVVIPYVESGRVGKKLCVITGNQVDQSLSARRWRAAVRGACKRGLLRRIKSAPSDTRYVAVVDTAP